MPSEVEASSTAPRRIRPGQRTCVHAARCRHWSLDFARDKLNSASLDHNSRRACVRRNDRVPGGTLRSGTHIRAVVLRRRFRLPRAHGHVAPVGVVLVSRRDHVSRLLTALAILFACAAQCAFSANRTIFNIGNVIAGVVLPSQEHGLLRRARNAAIRRLAPIAIASHDERPHAP